MNSQSGDQPNTQSNNEKLTQPPKVINTIPFTCNISGPRYIYQSSLCNIALNIFHASTNPAFRSFTYSAADQTGIQPLISSTSSTVNEEIIIEEVD